jgi:hypothetical protein
MPLPPAEPVTLPLALTAATPLLLQAPPPAVADNVIDDPRQKAEGPVIVPATGSGFTVIIYVATFVPQLFVAV